MSSKLSQIVPGALLSLTCYSQTQPLIVPKNIRLPTDSVRRVQLINALLAQKMEKEKGFPAVMEFLSCGKYEAGNDNYFQALDKITGINRSNFNANVEKLVEGEQ